MNIDVTDTERDYSKVAITSARLAKLTLTSRKNSIIHFDQHKALFHHNGKYLDKGPFLFYDNRNEVCSV